jgi:hypothetical protein
MEFFADDCVFYMPRGTGPRGDNYAGKDAVRAGLAKRFEWPSRHRRSGRMNQNSIRTPVWIRLRSSAAVGLPKRMSPRDVA